MYYCYIDIEKASGGFVQPMKTALAALATAFEGVTDKENTQGVFDSQCSVSGLNYSYPRIWITLIASWKHPSKLSTYTFSVLTCPLFNREHINFNQLV